MQASYTPGEALLVGAGTRWLLLSPDPGPSTHEALWALLTGATAWEALVAGVLDVVATACRGDADLVLVDLTPGVGRSLTRGAGRHTTDDEGHRLDLGATTGEAPRPLLGGVVGASRLVLRPVVVVPGPASGLIDGIPPEILAARAPAPSSEPSPRVVDRVGGTVRRDPDPVPGQDPAHDPDHDGRTTHRSAVVGGVPGSPSGPPPPVPQLQQPTHDTVLAVHCSAGHVTAAFAPHCRVCGAAVAPQEPHRMPRPRLGTLVLPDGERVPLDRGVVLGRHPEPVLGAADWPHLVRLPPEATYVSRSHLSVVLDGWLVLATDLGSRGGTTLRVPGRSPQRIRGHDPHVWEPGQVLDLADSYEIVYEVTA